MQSAGDPLSALPGPPVHSGSPTRPDVAQQRAGTWFVLVNTVAGPRPGLVLEWASKPVWTARVAFVDERAALQIVWLQADRLTPVVSV